MTSVEIPSDLYEQLKLIKKRQGYPIRQQVLEALLTHIEVMRETAFLSKRKGESI